MPRESVCGHLLRAGRQDGSGPAAPAVVPMATQEVEAGGDSASQGHGFQRAWWAAGPYRPSSLAAHCSYNALCPKAWSDSPPGWVLAGTTCSQQPFGRCLDRVPSPLTTSQRLPMSFREKEAQSTPHAVSPACPGPQLPSGALCLILSAGVAPCCPRCTGCIPLAAFALRCFLCLRARCLPFPAQSLPTCCLLKKPWRPPWLSFPPVACYSAPCHVLVHLFLSASPLKVFKVRDFFVLTVVSVFIIEPGQ